MQDENINLIYGYNSIAREIIAFFTTQKMPFLLVDDDVSKHIPYPHTTFAQAPKGQYYLAFGNTSLRQSVYTKLEKAGAELGMPLVHPLAYVSSTAQIGRGSIIMPYCYIGENVEIAENCLLLPHSVVMHDNFVDKSSFLSCRATIGGYSRLGQGSKVKMGGIVPPYLDLRARPNLEIGVNLNSHSKILEDKTERTRVDLSIVVPVYNEEQGLHAFYDAVKFELHDKPIEYEIIFVDDGSTDGSLSKLLGLRSHDQKVAVVKLSRNHGHHIAILQGLEHAKGSYVAMTDCDMQDPVSVIYPFYIRAVNEGVDCIYGTSSTKSGGRAKRVASHLFWWAFRKISSDRCDPKARPLRVMSRRFVDATLKFSDYDPFLAGIFADVGMTQLGVPIALKDRAEGKSKYSLRKMLKLMGAASCSTSVLPLRMATYASMMLALLSVLFACHIVYLKIFAGQGIPGWASLIVCMLFLGSVSLMSIGIMGEYLGRLYLQSLGRPRAIVENVWMGPGHDGAQ